MSRTSRVLRAVLRLTLFYLVLCGVVAVANRPFVFPAPRHSPPAIADAHVLEAHTEDGKTARALLLTAPSSLGTIVFWHGNGELASDRGDWAHIFVSHGYSVVLAEYRGYGISKDEGTTTERGIYADAEAVLSAIGTPNDHVVLMGFSMGTGVAVEMASRGHGRAMVLLAPYTSIPDVAARRIPVLPMRLLMRDKLDSRSKAAGIDMPVLVAHGDADTIVPFDMGETLAHTFPHGRFLPVPGAGHVDLFGSDDKLVQKIVDFLIEVLPL
jgi:pimeloyl-ACP methyl ester carboxylesterase